MTSPSPFAGEDGDAGIVRGPRLHPIGAGDGGGILLAVTISSGIMTLVLCGFSLVEAPDAILWTLIAAPMIFVIIFFIAILASVFFGLPVVYLLTKLGLEGAWSYSLMGALAGAAVIFLMFGFLSVAEQLPLHLGAIPGLLTGWIWWRYHRRHARQIGESLG